MGWLQGKPWPEGGGKEEGTATEWRLRESFLLQPTWDAKEEEERENKGARIWSGHRRRKER